MRAERPGSAPAAPEEPIEVRGAVTGIELVLSAGGTIAGRQLGLDFEELAGVVVVAAGPGGTTRGVIGWKGTYEVSGLAPGRWRVGAEAVGGSRRARGEADLAPGGDRATVDLDFTTGLSLAGRVLVDGLPAKNAEVAAGGGQGVAATSTDQRGGFRLDGLAPGALMLEVREPGGVLHRQTIELDDDRRLELRLATASIRGRAVDAANRLPLAGITFAAVALDAGPPEPVGGRITGEGGGFRFARLAAGRYRLVAFLADRRLPLAEVMVPPGGAATVGLAIPP